MKKKHITFRVPTHKFFIVIFAVFLYGGLFASLYFNTSLYSIGENTNNDRFFSMDESYYVTKIYSVEHEQTTRIVKHPLFMTGANLFSKAERLIFGEISVRHHYRNIILTQIALMLISLIFLIKILDEQYHLRFVEILPLSLIYILSNSLLIFTLIAESYIWSAAALVMFLYYLNKKKYAAVTVLFAVCTGITVTNAMICVLLLFFAGIPLKKKLITAFLSVLLFSALVVITPAREIFFENLTGVFVSSPRNYRDHFSFVEVLVRGIFAIFGSPLFYLDTERISPFGDFPGRAISFSPNSDGITLIFILLWIAILVFAIITAKKTAFLYLPVIALFCSIFLHGVLQYGLKEGFLYSLHHLFAQILIAAGLFCGKSRFPKNLAVIALYVIVAGELFLNTRGLIELYGYIKAVW